MKIGHLTDDIRQKALNIIANGATSQWLIIYETSLKSRQKVLTKFAKQIIRDNPKSLKPPKPKVHKEPIGKPYFNIGDVVVIKYPKEQYHKAYGVFLVVDIEEFVRKKEYHFAVTRYFDNQLPNLTNVLNSEVLFQDDLGFASSCWITHTHLKSLLAYFEVIAQVELITNKMSSFSPAETLDDFYQYVNPDDNAKYGGKTKAVYDVINGIIWE